MFEFLTHISIVGLLSLVVATLPLGAGVAYAIRPSEQRLALMRPVSLAGIFAGLCGLVLGALNTLRAVAESTTPIALRQLAPAMAESLVSLFLAFGCLTVAWLCVAIGMRRHL